jgi:arylsulfatase A-like enzyme
MRLAAATFMHTRQQVTLINLPEFDWPLGHVWGGPTDPGGVKTLMQGFDSDLAMLQQAYHKAGVLNRTIFVILADHGMMPLTHRISKDELVSAITKSGAKIVSDAYSTAGYFWLDRESLAPAAARHIANLGSRYIQSVYAGVKTSKGYVYQRVSSSKRLVAADEEATNQRLLQSFNGSNHPDVVVFFTEGTGSEPAGQSGWKADHGGASWEAQHLPLVISGPGVQQGHVSSYPARLIDVAPTVLQLMGIDPKRMQGTPLADAMTSTPSWAASRQKSISKALIPMVAAMRKASRAAA